MHFRNQLPGFGSFQSFATRKVKICFYRRCFIDDILAPSVWFSTYTPVTCLHNVHQTICPSGVSERFLTIYSTKCSSDTAMVEIPMKLYLMWQIIHYQSRWNFFFGGFERLEPTKSDQSYGFVQVYFSSLCADVYKRWRTGRWIRWRYWLTTSDRRWSAVA